MKIKTVRIRNFRSIKEQTIDFDDYTCFVGANGSGKTNILLALNVFFGESEIPGLNPQLLSEEDFHAKNTKDPIEIIITFSVLSPEAKKELSHYVRHNQLIVSAEAKLDEATGKAEVKQYGRRQAMRAFAPFFEAFKAGEKVAELKELYNKIKMEYSELPITSTKDAMRQALRTYEEGHLDKCEEIPSADEFYGIERGKNILEKYIQWVYIPAVKDVSSEQAEAKNTALGKLLARTVRCKVDFKDDIDAIRKEIQGKYEELLVNNQGKLEELSSALNSRLMNWTHNDASMCLKWHQDLEKAVRVDEPLVHAIFGEAGFEGNLTRFGHGLQRSFLLALLQELSGCDYEGGPRLILACEEPELYQHPPQARHLYYLLSQLSNNRSQIMIATHSPYFVSGEGFESVRMVRKSNGASVITRTTYNEVSVLLATARREQPLKASGQLAKIHQALQPSLSEMFFTSKIIFVEGLEDIAYLTTYLHLMDLWDNYRRLGCHMIATNGKSEMIQPVAVAKCLQIPVFALIDSDGDKLDSSGSREKHRKDNLAILCLLGETDMEAFPSVTYWGDRLVMWASDIGQVVAEDIGVEEWIEFQSKADSKYGHCGKMKKNLLYIASSLQLAWEADKRSESLQELCYKIIGFANIGN